jgi:phospholipid transport system substrate-binding protein
MAKGWAPLASVSRGARRLFLALLPALALVAAGLTPARAAEPAIEFMKQVSRDLLAAAKSGSEQQFNEAIQKYGHVPQIGLYALGNYKLQLQPAERSSYYAGMVRFLARYASAEAPKYQVSHAEIVSPPVRDDRSLYVDSRVYLKDGQMYEVRWLLMPQGDTFKVRDAQVMGFWMTPFLKSLFENYVAENGGNPRALVMALNR